MKQLDKMYDLLFQDRTMLNLFENFHSTYWRNMTLDEKKETIVKINQRVSELYEVDALKMKFNMANKLFGSANSFYWEIMMSVESLERDDGYEAVDTYFHEFRHSFQHRAIEGKTSDKESVSKESVALWKKNFAYGNYFGGDSPYYIYQPVEKDAWTTGLLFANRVHSVNAKELGRDKDYENYCNRHNGIITQFISESTSSMSAVKAMEKEIFKIYRSKSSDIKQEEIASKYVTELLTNKDVSEFTYKEVLACLSPYAFSKLSLKNKIKVLNKYNNYINIDTKKKIKIFENTVGSININSVLYGTGDPLTLVNSIGGAAFANMVELLVKNHNLEHLVLTDKAKKEILLNMATNEKGERVNYIKDTDNLFLFSLQPYARYEAYYMLERFKEIKDVELEVYKKNCHAFKNWETFYDNDAIYKMAEEIMDVKFDEYYKNQLKEYKKRITSSRT